MAFKIIALSESMFSHYFSMSVSELERHNAKRIIVREKSCFPCRVSLQDAEIGEQILAINFQHQPEGLAYRASHAIFVRPNQRQAMPDVNQIPAAISQRLLSVRAFNHVHDMVDAEVVEGTDAGTTIDEMFDNNAVDYLHLHNARPGCYAARVERA